MDPVLPNHQGNQPSKPLTLGKFAGHSVTPSSLAKGVGEGFMYALKAPFILFVPTSKLVDMEMMRMESDRAVLNVFKYRGAITEPEKLKRSSATTMAMESIGRDLMATQRFGGGSQSVLLHTTKDVMGLSNRCGCSDKQRIANLHYWIIACERDVNATHLSPEAKLGLQVMQNLIRETVGEFHKKNLTILGKAQSDYNAAHPDAQNNEGMATLLLHCLSLSQGRRQLPADVGYDFEQIKQDKLAPNAPAGSFGSAIIKDYYMAPPPQGLGLSKEGAKNQANDDYWTDKGPYAPDFWDGSPGRTLVDLMKHVDYTKIQELMQRFGGDRNALHDLRFPTTSPQGPQIPRAFEAEEDEDDNIQIPQFIGVNNDDDDDEDDDDIQIHQPNNIIILDDNDDNPEEPAFQPIPGERIIPGNDPIRAVEDADVEEIEVVQERRFEPEVPNLHDNYGVPQDFEPQIIDIQAGQGARSERLPIPNNSMESYQVDVQGRPNSRRAAPQRNVSEPSNEGFKVVFFDPGIIALFDQLGLSEKDRNLLKDFGAFEKLSRIFKKNPNMSVQDKLKAVEDMLKSVKRDLPLTQGLIHEYGMAPVGTSKDLGEVAMRELFSGLFSRGSAGSTVAGELGQMALELRQGRLNPEKQALLETLLAKKGKSLEAFKNFSPDSIFDGFRVEGFFNKEDFPALLALTSGREVVVIKRDSEGTFTPKTYSIDGTSIRESGQESVSPDQVVFFINEQNQWQVLRSVPSA